MPTISNDFQGYTGSWSDMDRALHDGSPGYAKVLATTTDAEYYAADLSGLPSSINVVGITVEVDGSKNEAAGSGTLQIGIELSWNNGSSYTSTSKKTSNLTTTETRYALGGAADTWGRSWTRSELQSGQFRVRTRSTGSAIVDTPEWRCDYVRVTIHYEDTTALTASVSEAARVVESMTTDRLVAEVFESAGAVEGGIFGRGHGQYGLSGTAIDELQAAPATFQSATAQHNAPHGLAIIFFFAGSGGSLRTLLVGDGGLDGTSFPSGVMEWGEIIRDASPGVEIAQPEALVRIRAGALAGSALTDTMAGHLRLTWAIGQEVRIYCWAREGTTWVSQIIFSGIVVDVTMTTDWYEFRCADLKKELAEFPMLDVRPGAMNYGTDEGRLPDQTNGQCVPVAWGRFDPLAVKAAALWPTNHPFVHVNTDNQWLIGPALGFRCPMVPAVLSADNFQKPTGVSPHPTMRHALFAFGDLRSPAIAMRTTASLTDTRNMRWPRLTAYFKDTDNILRMSHVGLWTWDNETDRGLPFLCDESTDLDAAERNLCGAGEYKAVRGVAVTAAALKDAQAFFVNRTNPNFSGSVPLWPGALQSIAISPEKFSEWHGTSDLGILATTSDVVNAAEALNTNPDTFATIPSTGRLSMEIRKSGPALGDIYMIRLCLLLGPGGTGTQIDGSLKFYQDAAGNGEFPFCDGDIAADDHPTSNVSFRLSPSFSRFGASVIYDPRFGPIPGDAMGWQISHTAGDISVPNGPTPHIYGWNYIIRPANGSIDVIHAWVEIIYRPRIGGVVSGFTGKTPIRSAWITRTKRGGLAPVNIRHDPREPLPERPIDNFSIWITGKSACDDDGAGTYTGTANAIIENPADIAGHVLAKYIGDFPFRAVGSAFGSFVRARTQLDAKIGGGDNWRLSPIIKERTTVRAFFDRLGEHSAGMILRQPASTVYEWRYFVDSHQPQTDAPERLYRTTGGLFKWADFFDDGFRVGITPLDAVASRFVLNYGYHEPTGTYSYRKFLSAVADNLESSGSNYRAACLQSEDRYGLVNSDTRAREFSIDLPWVWSHKVADQLIKWHANLRREPRLVVSLILPVSYLDLQPGHVITFDDSIAERLKYPRPDGSASWSAHYFNVTSVSVGREFDTPVFLRVEAVEAYTLPA